MPEKESFLLLILVVKSQRFQWQDNLYLKITLLEDTETLEEVVVVGYGTVKKSNVVGSIAKVGAEVIEDRPVSRVEQQALQGQMAGVSGKKPILEHQEAILPLMCVGQLLLMEKVPLFMLLMVCPLKVYRVLIRMTLDV